MSNSGSPVAICVAPNGARRTKTDHPFIPFSPAELAAEAKSCCEAGASVLHLHVRDDEGSHSLDPGRYRDAIAAIEDTVGEGLIIQITTEAVGIYSVADQMAVVKSVRPAAASVAFREISEGGEDQAAAFFSWASEEQVAIQHILYSPDELRSFAEFMQSRRLPDPAQMLFVIGKYGSGDASNPEHILDFLTVKPSGWNWSVCGFGAAELPSAAAAIGLGGHVRVGFENNLQTGSGEMAKSNADNVAAVAQIASLVGRSIANIDGAAKIYGVALRGRQLTDTIA